ncbi:hypothetical protein F4809DRAFT_614400 [Biscogniauxia mediterranea]|nr:hypothetical protein F4809DRAFT_614400 [Biscogniauxia mediterranea]
MSWPLRTWSLVHLTIAVAPANTPILRTTETPIFSLVFILQLRNYRPRQEGQNEIHERRVCSSSISDGEKQISIQTSPVGSIIVPGLLRRLTLYPSQNHAYGYKRIHRCLVCTQIRD